MLSSAMKPKTEPVAAVIKLTKAGNFPTGGIYMGPSGYAPYHDLAKEVPSNVDKNMQTLLKALTDGSIKTDVPPVKPAQ
jgi:basic membrane protein A